MGKLFNSGALAFDLIKEVPKGYGFLSDQLVPLFYFGEIIIYFLCSFPVKFQLMARPRVCRARLLPRHERASAIYTKGTQDRMTTKLSFAPLTNVKQANARAWLSRSFALQRFLRVHSRIRLGGQGSCRATNGHWLSIPRARRIG